MHALRSTKWATTRRRLHQPNIVMQLVRRAMSEDSTSLDTLESSARATNALPNTHEGLFFVDSVFPVRLSGLDLRHYIGLFQEEALLENLKRRLEVVKTHNMEITSLEPIHKDGGVFVKFKFTAGDPDAALPAIENELKKQADTHGLPAWLGLRGGNVWMVKGKPWREDMNWWASPSVKISFEGPDVSEQTLYQLCRPYGRIHNMSQPVPVPAGTLRSSTIFFRRISSAVIVRNTLHGLTVDTTTRLRISYQAPPEMHAFRDWLSSHPKIVLPIVIFLLGSLTYTIFDPIRTLSVEAKVEEWFDFREFKVYKWLRENTIDRFSLGSVHGSGSESSPTAHQEVWKERKEAVAMVQSYLSDSPSTVAFLHGPQGSGKTSLLDALLTETDRQTLIIDCRPLQKAGSDTQLISSLSAQTGYWPVFPFLNSLNALMDIASVGLLGQKTGLSKSLPDQLQQILDVVEAALKNVSSAHLKMIQRNVKEAERNEAQQNEDKWRQEAIKQGVYHDGRIDCVAGNGIMSELGFGIEPFDREKDTESPTNAPSDQIEQQSAEQDNNGTKKQRSAEDTEAIRSLPIVVIRNYEAKGGSTEDVLEALAHWAATLAENQIAHVIVVSDNRENIKRIAKALPSRPVNSIALSDADASSALSFVKQKLHDADIKLGYDSTETTFVAKLGGRASDLESLIHKVRSGRTVKEAVADIIRGAVAEIRKNGFGDDADEAKALPWSREQAWTVLKELSTKDEIPYHSVLLEFPFKGDEAALRGMEHAELITIGNHDGRPSTIRPGKPVYRYVFEQLVQDPIFQAAQDIALSEKLVASCESTIKACEQELLSLKEISSAESMHLWSRSPSGSRSAFLLRKMADAEAKLEAADLKIRRLKKVLASGDVPHL